MSASVGAENDPGDQPDHRSLGRQGRDDLRSDHHVPARVPEIREKRRILCKRDERCRARELARPAPRARHGFDSPGGKVGDDEAVLAGVRDQHSAVGEFAGRADGAELRAERRVRRLEHDGRRALREGERGEQQNREQRYRNERANTAMSQGHGCLRSR